MSSHPPINYLTHLINHPQFGFLFPNRIAVAVFGVPSRHYIDKWRPSLIEGQDWLTLPSETDSTPRVYYTLTGLPKLCDLVNTPQAQTFKQQLLASIQTLPSYQPQSPVMASGGSLVPTSPSATVPSPISPPSIYPSRYSGIPIPSPTTHTPAADYSLLPFASTPSPAFPTPTASPSSPTPPPPIAQLSEHLSATVASSVTPAIAHQINQSLSRQVAPLSQSVAHLHQTLTSQPQQPSLQEVAELYERAQDRAVSQVQIGVAAAQQVQAHTADHCGDTTVMTHTTHTSTSTTDALGSWLDSQDRWAIALIGSLVFCLVSVSFYCLLALVSSSNRSYSPQGSAADGSLMLVEHTRFKDHATDRPL